MTDPRATVRAYWSAVQSRDWAAFGALLTDDVAYDLPQTGERILGRERYVRFNTEYPGEWTVDLVRVVGADDGAASWISFRVGDDVQTGITFFDLAPDGRIARVTDFWPEPYEAPPGREHLVER